MDHDTSKRSRKRVEEWCRSSGVRFQTLQERPERQSLKHHVCMLIFASSVAVSFMLFAAFPPLKSASSTLQALAFTLPVFGPWFAAAS